MTWTGGSGQSSTTFCGRLSLFSPLFGHISRPIACHWISDAALESVPGYCPEQQLWWWYDLSPKEVADAAGPLPTDSKNTISLNLLELLGMVMTAWVMLVVARDRPEDDGDFVFFSG